MTGEGESAAITSAIHKTIKKVSSDIEEMKFNTAIASLMGLLNDIFDNGSLTLDEYKIYIRLLCPFAPHVCEELWEEIGGDGFCSLAEWPTYDEAKTVDSTVEIAVQINGKLRGTVMIPADISKDDALATVKNDERFLPFIDGKTVIKEIYVPKKLVNLVIK